MISSPSPAPSGEIAGQGSSSAPVRRRQETPPLDRTSSQCSTGCSMTHRPRCEKWRQTPAARSIWRRTKPPPSSARPTIRLSDTTCVTGRTSLMASSRTSDSSGPHGRICSQAVHASSTAGGGIACSSTTCGARHGHRQRRCRGVGLGHQLAQPVSSLGAGNWLLHTGLRAGGVARARSAATLEHAAADVEIAGGAMAARRPRPIGTTLGAHDHFHEHAAPLPAVRRCREPQGPGNSSCRGQPLNP